MCGQCPLCFEKQCYFANMHAVFVCLALCVYCTESAKILSVLPVPSYSHFTIGFRAVKELADRGHEVTLVSPYRQKNPIKNLREIELTGVTEELASMVKGINMFDGGKRPAILTMAIVAHFGNFFVEHTLKHENVKKLLQSNETFDVVILEQFMTDALQIFAHRFKAPSILISTVGSTSWTNRQVGNPAPPSYIRQLFLNYQPKMNFFQRTYNSILTVVQELYDHLYFLPAQNEILHKYVPDAPHIYDLIYNTSLILLNSHVSINEPVPHVPNMIEIGGFHVQEPKKLPDDLQNILDSATDGVILFSMGSNLKSKDMPPQVQDILLRAFAQLKMKILWKWEDDNLPGQPPNVIIRKWLPQTDILAHPNIKLFITHGGLLSTTEAVYFGVPVVGIPVYGDQYMNMALAENYEYGISIPYSELTEEKLKAALKDVIEKSKYAKNAKQRSKIMQDQPIKPLDTAVYWVEYIIRHKGAPHLRTAAISLQWYQYLLLDVMAFLTMSAIIIFTLFCFIIKKLLRNINPKQKVN